ncbi:hypothetical protein CDEF62S_00153 [Castellaniella defragrans]
MSTGFTFNATKWLSQNALGGTKISTDAKEAIVGFTTMWNFFESTICDNNASIQAFDRACKKLKPDYISTSTILALEKCLRFWRCRYCKVGGFTDLFDDLHFRPGDRRGQVEMVLKRSSESLEDKLLALMIIVYRLRNNLFHGLKTLDMLNDQVQNLEIASQCLAAILEAIPSRFMLVRKLPRQVDIA